MAPYPGRPTVLLIRRDAGPDADDRPPLVAQPTRHDDSRCLARVAFESVVVSGLDRSLQATYSGCRGAARSKRGTAAPLKSPAPPRRRGGVRRFATLGAPRGVPLSGSWQGQQSSRPCTQQPSGSVGGRARAIQPLCASRSILATLAFRNSSSNFPSRPENVGCRVLVRPRDLSR